MVRLLLLPTRSTLRGVERIPSFSSMKATTNTPTSGGIIVEKLEKSSTSALAWDFDGQAIPLCIRGWVQETMALT